MGKLPYALQLYTVRDHLAQNVAGTLRQVSLMGYGHVEIAGTHGLSDGAFKRALDEAGLDAVSAHMSYEEITGDHRAVVEAAKTLDVAHVVVPCIDAAHTPDKDGWRHCAQAMDAAGARLREAGITLSYHNHAHEFEALDGEYVLDIIMGTAQPEHLAVEIDTFWVQYAGLNPTRIIEKYRGRCPLLHVKDMADAKSKAFAEMGRGILNWPATFEAAADAGVAWYIVEQDTCARDSLESAAISAAFMGQQSIKD